MKFKFHTDTEWHEMIWFDHFALVVEVTFRPEHVRIFPVSFVHVNWVYVHVHQSSLYDPEQTFQFTDSQLILNNTKKWLWECYVLAV